MNFLSEDSPGDEDRGGRGCVWGWWFVKGRTTHRPRGVWAYPGTGSWSHWTTGDKSSGIQMGSELSRQWKQEPCPLEKLMQWLGPVSDVLWRWTHQVQWRI